MRGFIVLSRNTSTTWSGPVYFIQEKNGPRFGECYTQEKATIVSRQRFDELKDKRIIPEKAEFVCVDKEPMNNDTSDGGATVPCISLFDVTDLCQREGIELRGDDGKPYCCGERMNVRGGIIGPDFAECRKCGKAIGNVASPHINGGHIPSDEWIKENGNKTWYVLHTSNTKKGELK